MKIGIQTCPIVNNCGELQNNVLNALAQAAEAKGHSVNRFQHADCVGFDISIIWNGLYNWEVAYRKENPQQRFLFAELGWCPQKPCFQLDPLGVNAFASWAREQINTKLYVPIVTKLDKIDLLVVLQDDADTQIYTPWLSPMFRNMAEWLCWLAETLPEYRLRIRAHPNHPMSAQAQQIVQNTRNMKLDDSPNMAEAIDESIAMLSINSSSGIEGLQKGLPIIAFGRSVFSSVVNAGYYVFIQKEPREYTRNAISEIILGKSTLNRVAQTAAVSRIMSKQWWPDKTLAEKLEWWLR